MPQELALHLLREGKAVTLKTRAHLEAPLNFKIYNKTKKARHHQIHLEAGHQKTIK